MNEGMTIELKEHIDVRILDIVGTFNALKVKMGIKESDWITLSQQVEIVPSMLVVHPNTFNLVVRLINLHNATLARRTREGFYDYGQRN